MIWNNHNCFVCSEAHTLPLESVGEEEEEGVRKVFHMGEADLLSTQTHIVVSEEQSLAELDGKRLGSIMDS